ncbi:unnamed protein product [Haemonchus placei]|uniref:Scaffolding protein n=1 Tax=Haemonchus placei TaxID=6290 RepID=A0A0N4WQ26_HAEPC|nr:unnamed protein product [Haemonchus placei]
MKWNVDTDTSGKADGRALTKAEKDLERGIFKDHSQHLSEIDKNLSKLQPLKEQTEEKERKLSSLESCATDGDQYMKLHEQERHQAKNFPVKPEENMGMTDDEYFSKLIEETGDDAIFFQVTLFVHIVVSSSFVSVFKPVPYRLFHG